MKAFENEPLLELRRAAVRDSLPAALASVDARLPVDVGVLVGGDERPGAELQSQDPGEPERVVARCALGGPGDVAAAVEAAQAAGPAWSALGARGRAGVLVAAAGALRAQRLQLAALAVRECAKPWAEADADVCEAIDFLEYYARAAIDLDDPPALGQAPGEHNILRYRARGVAAVIAPWNFPLAIPAGMTAAALAAGSSVVLKPAEQSPACALALVRALRGAGVPAGALGLVPGTGEAGAALVEHPGVQTIAFTGSAEVGQRIVADAARLVDGQRHVKRVVAEMGGKNCVIVDADADLEEAVPAIVASAFGYAGQKCSAAARVLVCDAVADRLIERLAGAVELLAIGQAQDLATEVGPLIDREARDRVRAATERAARDGRLAAPVRDVPARGWFCAPALVTDVEPGSPVLGEEVFGPLLSVERVGDVGQALEIVDELPFALTGGVFSRSPDTIAAVAAASPVGNLYVNRAITGARVGRQPFGGNRLSGTGGRAGGPGYLLHFTDSQVVTENTVRHGLESRTK